MVCVEHEVEHLDVIAVGLARIVAELIGRELPVADDDERVLVGVFARILGARRLQHSEAEQTDEEGYDDLSGHGALSLYSVDFKGLAGDGEPHAGALAPLGLDIDGAPEALDEIVADAQPQACLHIIAVASDETVEDMCLDILGDAVARIIDGYDELLAQVVVAHEDATLRRVLHGIGEDLLDDHAHVGLVDVEHQLPEGLLHDEVHVRLLVTVPDVLALRLDGLREIHGVRRHRDHVGVEARQEEDVVDELQQLRGVVLDLVDEHVLIVGGVLHLEKFCEAHHGIERRADLEAHVVEEGVLHHFHLLGAERLTGQLLLHVLQLTDVTAHAEVVDELALLVVIGDEVELQVEDLTVTPMDRGLHVDGRVSAREVVHAVEQALHLLLRTLIHEVHQARLRQRVLYAIGFAENGQQVGLHVVFHNADASHGEHVVDVADIVGDLVVGLLQRQHVLLQCLVGVGSLGDVAARAEDSDELAVDIVDGQQLQLVVELIAMQHLVEGTVVGGVGELRDVHQVEILQIYLHAQHIVDGDLLLPDGLDVGTQRLEGLLVDILDDAVLVIEHHIDHGRLEDGLVAQHRVFHLHLAEQLVGDVAARAEDGLEAPALALAHGRQGDGVVVVGLLTRLILEDLDVEVHGLRLLADDVVEGLVELTDIIRVIAVGKLFDGGGALGPALLIHPREGLRLHIIGPEAHMTGSQHQRQAVVALSQLFGHAALTDAVVEVIDEEAEAHDAEAGGYLPYPFGDARLRTVGIEPLVLDGLQTVGGAQPGIDTVDLLQQLGVLRHELILAVGEVDGYDGEVVGMELAHEPFQRHRVPHDDAIVGGAYVLDGFLHVVVGHNLLGPSIVPEQVVTEAAFMHDDGMRRQGLARLYPHEPLLGHDDAVGEQLHDAPAVRGVAAREVGIHAQHEVRLAALQVCLGVESGLQLDDVGDVELLEDELQEVDVIAVGLAVLIQEHVGPQVPGILIDQRVRRGEGPGAVGLCLYRGGEAVKGQKHCQYGISCHNRDVFISC